MKELYLKTPRNIQRATATDTSNFELKRTSIEIIDLYGNLKYKNHVGENFTEQNDIIHLKEGVYICRFIINNIVERIKFLNR